MQARGSIEQWKKDPDRWRVRVTVGRDPITGSEKRLSKVIAAPHNRTGRRAAEDVLAELISQAKTLRRSTQRVPDGMTVADLAERWTRSRRPSWEAKTEAVYQGVLDRHIVPAIGGRPIAELTHEDLEDLYARHAETPRTARQIHATMRTMLGQAVRWRAIPHNPAMAAQAPPYESPEIDPPDPDAVVGALAVVDERWPDFALFLRLAATMGSRRAELCALQWRDFDLDVGTVWVRRAIARNPSGGVGAEGHEDRQPAPRRDRRRRGDEREARP